MILEEAAPLWAEGATSPAGNAKSPQRLHRQRLRQKKAQTCKRNRALVSALALSVLPAVLLCSRESTSLPPFIVGAQPGWEDEVVYRDFKVTVDKDTVDMRLFRTRDKPTTEPLQRTADGDAFLIPESHKQQLRKMAKRSREAKKEGKIEGLGNNWQSSWTDSEFYDFDKIYHELGEDWRAPGQWTARHARPLPMPIADMAISLYGKEHCKICLENEAEPAHCPHSFQQDIMLTSSLSRAGTDVAAGTFVFDHETEELKFHHAVNRFDGTGGVEAGTVSLGLDEDTLRRQYLDNLRNTLVGYSQRTDFVKNIERPEEGTVPYNESTAFFGTGFCENCYTNLGLQKLQRMRLLLEHLLASKVPGDIVEAGAWRGGLSMMFRGITRVFDPSRRVYVCDSFQGLPVASTTEVAGNNGDFWAKLDLLAVDIETVKEGFQRMGVLDENVFFMQGFFQRSMPLLRQSLLAEERSIALLYVDADMFEGYYDVLFNMYVRCDKGP